MGYKAVLNIFYAISVASVIAPFVFYFDSINLVSMPNELVRYIILFWLVSTFLIIGTRQIARFAINSIGMGLIKREFIIYGAGSAGRSVASALLTNKDVRILGYLDDDESLHGMYVNNYPVLGGLNYIQNIGSTREELSVLLAVPSMETSRRREVLRILDLHTSEGRQAALQTDEAYLGAYRFYKAMKLAYDGIKTDRLEDRTDRIEKILEQLFQFDLLNNINLFLKYLFHLI